MFVRQLQDNEILDGLHLVWDVFAGEIAPFYSPQGIAEFQNFIRIENFMVPVKSGEMVVFGAVEEGELCGVSAVRSNGHVALLFVKRNWQRRGVARMLMASMEQYCTGELGLMRMTVNASPNAVEAYRRMGFRDTMPLMEQNGIRFVPMEHLAPPGSVRPQKMGKVHKGLFVGIVACAAILSIFPAWFLAPTKLIFLAVPLLTLFLGGFVSAFLVPLVSTLPEDQESIPDPEVTGTKAQLTCPKCGKAPVMGAMEKALLFTRSVPRCPWCGTPLSNPAWFDIIRLLVMIGVPVASYVFIRSRALMILLFGVILILTGLISLYCIPLQKHWNVTGDD